MTDDRRWMQGLDEYQLMAYSDHEAWENRAGRLSVRQIDALVAAHRMMGNETKAVELEAERQDAREREISINGERSWNRGRLTS